MADFPKLSRGESPSLYKGKPEDNALKSDTDGGTEFRRTRFTKPPRLALETGFKGLPNADFEVLDAFYMTHTTVVPFVWFDYIRQRYHTVRFDDYDPQYVGIGKNRMWDVKIKMMEV